MTIRWLHNLYVDLVYRIFIVTRNLLFALGNDSSEMIQDSSGDGLFSVPVIDILSRYIYEKMYSKIDWKIDMEVRSRGK